MLITSTIIIIIKECSSITCYVILSYDTKISVYLDDVAGTADTLELAVSQARTVRTTLESAGFTINDKKSVW